jgi:hypothetical protein
MAQTVGVGLDLQADLQALEAFIVRAKARTYVGGGQKLLPYRLGSKDLQMVEGDWAYHDSYFGEADFAGQEVVYFRRQPVWCMNYFGRILRPDLITAAEAGRMIMDSLSRMYAEGRFLGGFSYDRGDLVYTDTSQGDVTWFTGREWITRDGQVAYELIYHGGLIRG